MCVANKDLSIDDDEKDDIDINQLIAILEKYKINI
jgi:hypothetical protein